MSEAEAMVRGWADEQLNKVNQTLVTLEARLYRSYEPTTLPPNVGFWQRLDRWLTSVDARHDDHRRTMFKLAAEIFYVGPDEFIELYRLSYNGPIARWLIDDAGISLQSPTVRQDIADALSQTWFCPISDSLRINQYYHVNNIPAGSDYRPDWRSVAELVQVQQITEFCNQNNIRRLVLVEDFVGGGSQMETAVNYAALNFPGNVLVVPLVICPEGIQKASELEALWPGKVKFEPIVAIPKKCFVEVNGIAGEDPAHSAIRALAFDTYGLVTNGEPSGPGVKPYHPLGYPYDNPTGGVVVMFANTPDNSIPLIHWTSESWSPLFPRHSRV